MRTKTTTMPTVDFGITLVNVYIKVFNLWLETA